ncbi:MAG TPA: nodulation protein NfeD [Syntrophomonadaceae bacterium]|jgi:membrane-bound serine protease (ClpP class)|nr:nodulation protein NfeD [Syntrophomonadaceae bacterium]HPU49381.1 nodulation protein NfeD [Syntrophomonadaceae bacterium]
MFKIQHSLNEPRFRIKRVFLVIFALLLLINIAVPLHAASDQPLVYVLEVEKTVTFGTARYIERGLEEAQSKGADACIISLNTPGGLVDATLEIIQDMSAARIPVITYVNPEGGIAASAGTFILLNGHIAAMAPGTTCGAAMPVTISPSEEGTQAADQKTINFLAGHMKSIADQRGRPADLAGKFVTDNLVLNNREALEKGVIDYVAADKEELLNKIHDTAVTINGQEIVLRTAGAQIVTVSHNTSEKVTNLISDPTLSMLFLTIGVMGLLIGFYSPGFFLPETLGAICLILGLSGVGLFQSNLTAGLLILLGIGLLVAELFTPTFGILGVGGVVSIVIGILLFPNEPLMPGRWFTAFRFMALGVGLVMAGFLLIAILGIARLRGRKPVQGNMESWEGVAATELNPRGLIRISGEIWQAETKDGNTVKEGELVRVVERKGLLLLVEPVKQNKNGG